MGVGVGECTCHAKAATVQMSQCCGQTWLYESQERQRQRLLRDWSMAMSWSADYGSWTVMFDIDSRMWCNCRALTSTSGKKVYVPMTPGGKTTP